MKETPITREDIEEMGLKICHEVHLAATIALALDTMLDDIDKRMKEVKPTLGLKHECKKRYNDFTESVRMCRAQFEQFVEPAIINSGRGDDFADYETRRVFSQELIRLLMLYYEQTRSSGNHAKVFDFLASLDGGRGIFTADDINRFNLGCK